MNRETPSYYSILTATIRYAKNISADEKILYSEITALTNKNGYCHATNAYFAELYDKHIKTISKWINNLVALGYLKSVIIRDEKTMNVQERRLYINDTPLHANADTPLHANADTPLHANAEYNNTSINNINNNKDSVDDNFEEIAKLIHTEYEKHFAYPIPHTKQHLVDNIAIKALNTDGFTLSQKHILDAIQEAKDHVRLSKSKINAGLVLKILCDKIVDPYADLSPLARIAKGLTNKKDDDNIYKPQSTRFLRAIEIEH